MANDTPEKTFETLKSNVVDTIQSYFPFEGRHKTLVVDNVRVEDNLNHDDVTSQAEAKDKETTWGVPIRADLKLIDKITGKVVDTKKGQIIARLPKLTNRYGYIVNGNEYQVDHLFRLKSGVYSRVQDNGDLETEFNLAKSPTGKNFSVKLDRVNKKFSLKLDNAHIPLYPILKSTGVSDDQIEKAWGKEIFAANKPKTEEKFNKSLSDFWKRTSDDEGPAPTDPGVLAKHLNTFMDGTVLRADTTSITLGRPVTKVDGQVLQMAADKILGVSKGTHKPDDRDSLAFKEVWSAEDFIPEKISKAARSIRSKLRQTVDHKQNVGDILSSDMFNRPIHEFFSKGGSVAERSDQTNPIQMLSAHRKTTLMSKELGGIKNENQVTDEMRKVNPTHLGFLDPIHTPESERTGITLHLASGVTKVGKDLETRSYDLKAGKQVQTNIGTFHNSMVVLPDQVRWVDGKPVPFSKEVKVKLPGGDIEMRPFKDASHVLLSSKGAYNYATNLVPFLPSDQGNRVSMADKQLEQCISLKYREVPLVQSKTDHPTDPSHTFEKLIGGFTASKAIEGGTVTAVKPDGITIKSADGKKHEVSIYNHFPLNDPKGMMHSEPIVKVGDSVKKGQIIADTNHTKNGSLAYGTNLRVGYIPFKGYNFEDGIVISETASKKLTSEHLHKKSMEIDPEVDHISKTKLKAHAVVRANKIPKEHWDALDDDGIIKPGSRILPGQIMVAAVGKNNATKASHAWGALGKKALSPFKDKSLVWDEDHVGVVTKVIRQSGGKGVKVYVKTEEPAVIGDKISGRHGNKGIITQILPDHEMPFTKNAAGDRHHIDVALNPSGIPTRINVGQLLETAAAKIAEKTGKTYVVDNFEAGGHADHRAMVMDELKKHGLSDEELVFDPKDVRTPLGSVTVGPQYILKQRHQVEKKLTARGGGTDISGRSLPYDIDKQPTKGGERGGQGFGALEMYSMLGHNARHNIREMATYKSDQQDMTFWSMVQEGHEPPPPRIPFAYQKFEALLKGLGVNVVKEGTAIRLMPMTNHEILKLSGNGRNEIKDGSKTLLSKNLKPEVGGLFDPVATGGVDGDKWSHLRLAEPIPNPIFVGHNNMPGPIPALLGLKMKEVDAVMGGRMELNGKTGGRAIEEALKKVDVEAEIKTIKTALPGLKEAPLDRANKKLKYLLALKDVGMKPHEAYILHNVPVLPPKFRPATTTPTGDVNYSSLNGLYKNISLLNDQVKNFDHKHMPAEELHPLRAQMWDSMKALQSVGSYKPVYDTDQSGNRELKGILDIVGGGEGEQPKEGFFQSKLVKRKMDLSMRSTIVPEPSLGIDEVGLPKHAAMEMYKPYVVSQLHKWGMTPLAAQDEMKKGTALAFKALEHATNDHLVILKRDPALHKASVQAFRPKLIEGKAIQIHPLICEGFNADFDGDTMAATVPMTRDAIEEAKKMLPSANLFSPTHGGVMYNIDQEQVLGLHYLAKWGKKTGKTFETIADAKKAQDKNEIHVTDVIKIKGAPDTTLGRLLIAEKLPSGFSRNKEILHDPDMVMTKGMGREIGSKIAKETPHQFAKSIDGLKDLGNKWSFNFGASIGLKDFAPLKEREGILNKAHKEVHALKETKGSLEHDKAQVDIYQRATVELEAAAKKGWDTGDNRLSHMIHSGSRGAPEQLRQMIAAPMLMQDASNRIIPTPVTRSYAEGLDFGDYWLTQHGARKGTLQRSQGTSEPGAITKDIINSTMSTLIVSNDCKTNQGVLMDLTHRDIHDRFLAAPYKLKSGVTLRAGELVTPDITSMLKNSKVDKVLVRSPLKCTHGEGICAKCYGLNENGRLHDVGINIGVLAGQSIGQPASQMSMNAFHSGGVATGAGASSVDAFTRLRQIVHMPKTLKNEAALAHASGPISEIKKDATGGIDIYVGGVRHYVPKALVREDITQGMEVKKGQKLSFGFTNPHTLLDSSKDIHAVQNYLTSALHSQAVDDPKNNEGEGLFGKKSRRRNVEVVVRALTNLTRVKDPGHSEYSYGDIVPRSEVEEHNKSLGKGKKGVEHEPILKGVSEIPALMGQNWMARLNYQELHSTVQQAASRASKSELHGAHPIPGMALGTEFGKPPTGSKKHVY